MVTTYKVGQAPWETQSSTPTSYAVGQAPWETNTIVKPVTPMPTLQERLASQGYAGQVGAEQLGGITKIGSSISKGAQDIQKGFDTTQPLIPRIGNTLKGFAEAAFGTITGAAQAVLAPVTPVISKVTTTLTPALRAANPQLAQVYDQLVPKLSEFATKHPDASTLMGDIINTLLLMAGGAGGKAVAGDVVKNTLSKEGLQTVSKDVVSTIPKVTEGASGLIKSGVSNLKEVATSGGKLTAVEKQLAEQPLQKLDLQNQIRDLRLSSKGTLQDITSTFQKTTKTLQDTLANEAKLQVEQNKGTLKTLFRDMTSTYGQGLKKAETALTEKGVSIDSRDYLNVINKTLETAKSYGIDVDNPAVKILQEAQSNFQNTIKESMPLTDLIRFKNQVYDTLTAGVKAGTKYSSSDDLVANNFLRNHGEFIGEMSPELKLLNKEFAPMAQARSWAMKNFKPYSPDEIQKGANVLSQIANGKVPNQTSLNYLQTLEQGSGVFEGVGSLKGSTTGIGMDIKATKEVFDTTKQNLISSTDFQINKLQTEIANLQKRGIELGQRADQLKHLKTIRNWIIGISLTTALGGKGIVERAVGFMP